MSIREDARRAQAEASSKSPEIVERALALYDAMDALTEHQKHLLVEKVLMMVSHGITAVATEPDPATRAISGASLVGLIGLAGYTSATLVEDANSDTDRSKAVEAIFDQYRGVHSTMTARLLGVSAEDQVKADRISDAVQKRVDAGEDPRAALKAEIATSDFDPETIADMLKEAAEDESHQSHEVADLGGTGLYL